MTVNQYKLLELLRFLANHRPDFGSVVVGTIIVLIGLHVAGVMDGSPSITHSPQTLPPRAPAPETVPAPAPKGNPLCVDLPNGKQICNDAAPLTAQD